LWHGAEFKYIAYGLYNGIVIVSGLLLEPVFRKILAALHIDESSRGWKGFRMVRTFFVVLAGRVFPKAVSFTAAVSMFFSMFRLNSGTPFTETMMNLGLTGTDYAILAACCFLWLLISIYEERKARSEGGAGEEALRNMLDEKPLPLRWALILIMLGAVLAMGIYGPNYDAAAFIYRGF
ncbi:MAG: hypothetical protein ACSW8G_00090, partial [Bacillota bacterium]